MLMMTASRLNDSDLTAELGRLAHGEREATAALIVHLAEFDARRLYEGAGYSSMFQYGRAVLRMSEDAVYNRIGAARAARRFPAIVDMLVSGVLSPTTARLLSRHLTAENHEALLAAASGLGKLAVKELLAAWFPEADVAPRIRKLPGPPANAPAPVPVAAGLSIGVPISPLPSLSGVTAAATTGPAATAALAITAAVRPALVRPLSAERFEVRFTASAEMRERLREAQDLLGHAVPSGDLAQVFDRALVLLVAELKRKKFAATKRTTASRRTSANARRPTADVRRAVTARDGGRCRYVAKDGHRCGERRFLEFHHIVPYAAGGRATVDNIELRCRAHNGHEVDRFFGPGWRYSRDAAARRTRSEASSDDWRTPPPAGWKREAVG
jgi:5-methylcytosine-specific restriction endonuclease McrA